MKKLIAFLHFSLFCFLWTVAQQPSANWTVSVEPVKRFIENKSQFDGRNELPGTDILFGIDQGRTQVFFTKNGLTYRLADKKKRDEWEERMRESEKLRKKYFNKEIEEEEAKDRVMRTDVVQMEWLNSNPDARLIGLERADDYFSYSIGEKDDYRNINRIAGYKRLLYENLYPGIDVEYAFHPETGIKYKLVIHPGADVSKVKMKYSDTGKIVLDEQGNIRIGTEFGDIIDHAPVTFYLGNEKKIIRSAFSLSGNMVSFPLGNYDNTKAVIIDPWTTTPAMPVANKVYYIKTDSTGNAYAYGGDSPYQLQKFDSSGALVWTYTTSWSVGAENWFGGLAVDPVGNSYITSGTNPAISKINSNGDLVWSNSPGNFYEYWAPTFNCDYSQLLIGGTYLVDAFTFKFFGGIYDVNLNTGAIDTFIIVAGTLVGAPGTFPFIPNEVRSMSFSPNGNYYFLTMDTVGSLTQSLAINYRDSSYYNLTYYLPYGQGGGQGLNGICATKNLLYTTDGQTLHKRSITDGSVIKTVTIPNGSKEINSGIAADGCGNVYVGAVTKIHKYDSDLNLLASANVPAEVYDLSVTKSGEVLACGHGFAASINMTACNPVRPFCLVSTSQKNLECSNVCSGEATANGINGTAPYSYRWSDGQTNSTATNLCAGTHVVTVTDATGDSIIASVIVTEPQTFTASASSFYASGCDAGAVVVPTGGTTPYTYEWSTGDTLSRVSPVALGTYTVSVYDDNNCLVVDSIDITNLSAFPLNKTATANTCGNCDGTATVLPSGGNAPYTYLWSSGATTQAISGLCAGTYSVTVTETAGTGGNVFWNEDFTTGGTDWTLNLSSGTNGTSANLWVINNDTSNCSPCPPSGSKGNYLHITCNSTDFICSASGNFGTCNYSPGFAFLFNSSTDKFVTSPDISTIGKTNITLRFWYMSEGDASLDYGLVRLSNNGGSSWTDLPTKYSATFTCTQASATIPATYENISNFRIAFRWVNNNDMNGNDPPFVIDDIELSTPGVSVACTATDTVTVNSPNGGDIFMTASITNVLCQSSSEGGIKLIPSGGTPPLHVLWSTGDTVLTLTELAPDVYEVTITDSKGCTSDSSFSLTSSSTYSVETAVTNASCDGSPTGSADANILSGTTPPYSFTWSTGETTDSIVNLAPGVYKVTVSDSLHCLRIDSAEVGRGLNIQERVIGPCPSLSNGSILTTVTGGAEPYSYSWNTGATTSSLLNINAGTYSLTVSDVNDCMGNDTIVVLTDSSSNAICDTLIFYDVFSPNGDGKNEYWVIDGIERFPENEVQVFNRWGNVIFEAKSYSNTWNGRSDKDELLPSATYYYILKLHDKNESVYSGNVTLIR